MRKDSLISEGNIKSTVFSFSHFIINVYHIQRKKYDFYCNKTSRSLDNQIITITFKILFLMTYRTHVQKSIHFNLEYSRKYRYGHCVQIKWLSFCLQHLRLLRRIAEQFRPIIFNNGSTALLKQIGVKKNKKTSTIFVDNWEYYLVLAQNRRTM